MPPFDIDPDRDTLCDVVRRWAEVQPDAPAFLEVGRDTMSYAALVATMDRLGRSLADLGYGTGDRIGVVHTDGTEMASLIIGVMSAATVLPVDSTFTVAEFASAFRRQDIDAVIIQTDRFPAARQAAQTLGIPAIEAEALEDAPAGSVAIKGTPRPDREGRRAAAPGPRDLALILTTSGTTSAAKIVPIRHDEFSHRLLVLCRRLSLSPQDCFLHFRPMQYGNGANSVGRPLHSGGSIVFFGSGLSAEEFRDRLSDLPATWLNASPTFFENLLRAHAGGAPIPIPSRLRFAISSSSRTSASLIRQTEKILGCPVVQGMGIAEAGWVAVNPIEPGRAKPETVGLPLCDARIRGDDGQFLPAGSKGEIVLRGPQVFKGYIDDSDATMAAFAGDWFRTGDEGSFDEDGFLTLSGRLT